MSTYYLGNLANGRLVSRSSTRSDFTHAAIHPLASASTIPSFGTNPHGARKNAECNCARAAHHEIEVCAVRVVTAKEYNAARKAAK